MARPALSETMQRAIGFAAAHGGTLHRQPGGFWSPRAGTDLGYYGTSTIEALVKRGLAEYTVWREGRNGRFPVEMRLTDEGQRIARERRDGVGERRA